jgi:hypothetical protein
MLTPGRLYPGSPIRLTTIFTNSADTEIDPTTVSFRLFTPSRSEFTGSPFVYGTDDEVGKSSTGNYYADVTPDESGRWYYRWESTGSGTTIAEEGFFLVQWSPFYEPTSTAYQG